MFPFKAPVDDILFSLHHVAGGKHLEQWDIDEARSIIEHFAEFAEEVIAPLNSIGDATGARLENGRVILPEGFKDAYTQLAEQGWQGLTLPEAHGGMEVSHMVASGISEIFTGANHALQMVCGLVPGAVTTLLNHGNKKQQNEWIPRLASGEMLSTMCLSEPGAGSDLSAIRCKATQTPQGWQIDGEKIFISGGGQDISKSILHLVLARTGAIEEGINGLSLFLCPQQLGVQVTRIEDKLGIHASPTCQMRFNGAEAELIGIEGKGLQAMFTLMNHARLDVSLQGVAHSARAHSIAKSYAEDRLQGKTHKGKPAHLADHADIQRMLNLQECLTLGARAMCHLAYSTIEAEHNSKLADFLTPLCKIFCSKAGIKSADIGMQILGGYGYLKDYGMEQVWRDARITAIYEGANGIHERSIATRMLRPEEGSEAFTDLIIELIDGHDIVRDELNRWQKSKAKMQSGIDPLPLAHDFAQETSALFFKAAWAQLEKCADHHVEPDRIKRLASFVMTRSFV